MTSALTPAQATALAQQFVESEGQVWTALSPAEQADEIARVVKLDQLTTAARKVAVAAPPVTSAIVAPAANQRALARANALRTANDRKAARPPGLTREFGKVGGGK